MVLPTNATPVYTLTIPSSKKEFKYRPFLVKEQKALLIAHQSENLNTMLDTVKSVIVSCAKNDIDVDTLSSFDIEYIFLQMRANSIGEIVEMVFSCDEDHGDLNEKAKVVKQINLLDAKVETFEGHEKQIPLFGNIGMMMKYPGIETLKKLESDISGSELDVAIDIISDCIDYVYDGEEIYPAKDQKKTDLIEFLNNLTNDQFNRVKKFFQTLPQLRVYVEYTCPVCSKHHNRYLEGLASFF